MLQQSQAQLNHSIHEMHHRIEHANITVTRLQSSHQNVNHSAYPSWQVNSRQTSVLVVGRYDNDSQRLSGLTENKIIRTTSTCTCI